MIHFNRQFVAAIRFDRYTASIGLQFHITEWHLTPLETVEVVQVFNDEVGKWLEYLKSVHLEQFKQFWYLAVFQNNVDLPVSPIYLLYISQWTSWKSYLCETIYTDTVHHWIRIRSITS